MTRPWLDLEAPTAPLQRVRRRLGSASSETRQHDKMRRRSLDPKIADPSALSVYPAHGHVSRPCDQRPLQRGLAWGGGWEREPRLSRLQWSLISSLNLMQAPCTALSRAHLPQRVNPGIAKSGPTLLNLLGTLPISQNLSLYFLSFSCLYIHKHAEGR